MEKVINGLEWDDFCTMLRAKTGGRYKGARIVRENDLGFFNLFSVYDLKTAIIPLDSRS